MILPGTTTPLLAEDAAPVAQAITRLDVFHSHVWVLLIAFLVTLAATPVMRRLAIKNGVVDRPNEARKIHKMPVAYMGGVAVFLGIVAGIFWSYLTHFAPDAFGIDPACDAKSTRAGHQRLRPSGPQFVQRRPRLPAYLQHILEPGGGDQSDLRTAPLQQRVGANGRTVDHFQFLQRNAGLAGDLAQSGEDRV